MAKISSLFIYPIKSLGGISLDSSFVNPKGLEHDRAWMLVDEAGRFLTQREHRRMALLHTSLETQGFCITDKISGSTISIPKKLETGERIMVTVWDDQCPALVADNSINQWFSERLEHKCRLVFMPEDSIRQVDPEHCRQVEHTRFTDGYPILLVSASAMTELNEKTGLNQDIRQFRPNIVVEETAAHAEDGWSEIKLGSIQFYIAKACERCVVTTIDPETSEAGPEPLRSLASYRKKNKKIYFGQNMIALGEGTIAIGDRLEILQKQHSLFDI